MQVPEHGSSRQSKSMCSWAWEVLFTYNSKKLYEYEALGMFKHISTNMLRIKHTISLSTHHTRLGQQASRSSSHFAKKNAAITYIHSTTMYIINSKKIILQRISNFLTSNRIACQTSFGNHKHRNFERHCSLFIISYPQLVCRQLDNAIIQAQLSEESHSRQSWDMCMDPYTTHTCQARFSIPRTRDKQQASIRRFQSHLTNPQLTQAGILLNT